MTFQSLRHEDLSDLEIIQRCLDPNRQIIAGVGNLVIKLSDEVVVKFGWGVTAEEASNQRKAFELLDCSIVRIPRVYRYFTQIEMEGSGFPPTGFIVMEYIDGEICQSPTTEQVDKIAHIFVILFEHTQPAPWPSARRRYIPWTALGGEWETGFRKRATVGELAKLQTARHRG